MAGLATKDLGKTDDPNKPMTEEEMYKCTVKTTPAPPATPALCKNKNTSCDYWAGLGYCTDETYVMYMMVDCEKACKFC